MDIEKEIELLELLQNTPMPPDPAPVPTAMNGTVKVPPAILDYFKKIDVKLDLDKEGRMKVDEYSQLIDDYHIPTYGIKMVTFVTVDPDKVRKEQSKK